MTMAKYEVSFYYHTLVTVVVDAEDADDALGIAEMEVDDEKYNEQILRNLTKDADPDVELIGRKEYNYGNC